MNSLATYETKNSFVLFFKKQRTVVGEGRDISLGFLGHYGASCFKDLGGKV